MSTQAHAVRKELVSIAVKALFALFLIPLVTLLLANHFKRGTDARYLEQIEQSIAQDRSLSAADRPATLAFYESNLASSTCFNSDPDIADYRNGVCASYSEMWQFVVVEKIALLTVIGGVMLVGLMILLGVMAFSNRGVQYVSFVFGWRVLTLASALEIILQGAFLVWLSFWVTAYFMNEYIPKLIIIIAIVAAIAIFTAIRSIFRKVQQDNHVQGELITPEVAPALWSRIREFASKLNTAPPAQIIAGIDANFYVTEFPLQVGEHKTSGRSLFVSLPLLRVLDQTEADAVLAHELGHFVGGDTQNSAALGPKLMQYDDYNEQMRIGGVTFIAHCILNLYRVIFEMALQKSSREREFAADTIAAGLTSPQAISHSLVKVAAYSNYRNEVEGKLFEQDQKHSGSLGIAQRVAMGLNDFSQSNEFMESMRAGNVPHPFDSHPPLPERMKNVGYELSEQQFASVVCTAPSVTWIDSIHGAEVIEQRQWQAFEQNFSQVHEETLAYRYEPSTDEERELVLRYFPDVHFAMKNNQVFEINYAGILTPESPELIGWDRVKNLTYNDASIGADKLVVEHPEKGMIGAKTTKLSIAISSKERERFKAVLGQYWHRHQVMRAQVKIE
jgi:Zn-dependent protease with chaperone function